MKKVLAVLLAVILAFSMGTASFAADLTEEPSAQSGMVKISAKSIYIEAGETYTVPVSVISNYTPEDLGSSLGVAISFGVSFSGSLAQYAQIMDIQIADSIKNADGFYQAEVYGDPDNEDNYVSFIVNGDSLLTTDRTEIAYITIKIADDCVFTGEETEELEIALGDGLWGITEKYSEEYTGTFADYIDDYVWGVAFAVIDSAGNCDELTVGEDVVFSPAHCLQKPYEPTWSERLITVLKTWGYQIVTGIVSLLQVAQSFLKPAA